MTMTYDTLVAAKGSSGAIATWVNYSKLDVGTIVDEAQSVIYQTLRCREMRVSTTVTLTNGQYNIALPGASTGQFLEPIVLRDITNGVTLIPNDERFVSQEKLQDLRSWSGSQPSNGTPGHVAIYDEKFNFDFTANANITYELIYFQKPTLLATGSPQNANFLTNRYPQVMRTACMALAAEFMKDSEEYQKLTAALGQLIQAINQAPDITQPGVVSGLNTDPGKEASILSVVPSATAPADSIFLEAQALVFARLRVREMKISTPLTLNSGSNTIALPGASTGQFLEPIAFYDATGALTFIPNDQRYVSQQRLLQLQANPLATGTPAYVSIFNENLNFDVNSSGTTTFTLVYFQRPTNLTSRDSSSFLTLRYPNILRTASQAALFDYNQDSDNYNKAIARLDALCQAANAEAAKLDSQIAAINQPNVEGSLLSFVGSTTTPVQAVLAEAQQLLYGILRTREMMTDLTFTMPENSAFLELNTVMPPTTGFLEPIGPIQTSSFNSRIRHKDAAYIQTNRNYTETTGSFGTNPFTTTTGSTTVSVALTNHGFTQDSIINISGAVAFNGVTLNGTFPINGITDANDFTIDITSLGVTPTGNGAGGGSAVTYLCDSLTAGTPYFFGVWSDTAGNAYLKFEQAFFQTTVCRMQYYYRPALLTSQDQTNFLTNRYPQLFRIAMQAAEANMRRDRATYDTIMAELTPLVQVVNTENDMSYRGLDLDPWIP